MKKKCHIYTRVSTAAQTEGYSLEAQQERLRQYAEYKNLEIACKYCDAGKSGKSILGRPAFMEMMDDIARGKDQISYVLVFKLSRFGRNAADVLKSIQTLLDYDVDLVCVEDSIDSSTQGGRLTLAILSAVAEIERENIRVQFMAGRMQKMMEGGWAGGPAPFGYRNKNGKLTVEPGEAEIVRLIYAKYLEPDMKLATVVRWLNDHGHRRISRGSPCPYNRDFAARVLDNPFYCGKIVYYHRTNRGMDEQNQRKEITVRGKQEAIIPEEMWDRVQEKRKQMAVHYEKDEPDRISMLSGLVKCPLCGAGLVMQKNKHVNKNREDTTSRFITITLLPALARLLKMDLNTLMSFHEDLSDIEIENFVNELNKVVQEQNYNTAFQMAIDKIHEYPTCNNLIYTVTLYLDGALLLYNVPEPEQYREIFETFYKRLSVDETPEIRDTAISMLIAYARNRGEYSTAEELINMLPFSKIDREEQLGELTVYKEGQVLAGADVTEDGVTFCYESRRQGDAVYNVYAGGDIVTAYGAKVYSKGDLVKANLVADNVFMVLMKLLNSRSGSICIRRKRNRQRKNRKGRRWKTGRKLMKTENICEAQSLRKNRIII